jgi:hypothetical protein
MKNEIGETFGTYGRQGWCIQKMGVGKPEGKTLLRKPRLDGRIILKWIFKT